MNLKIREAKFLKVLIIAFIYLIVISPTYLYFDKIREAADYILPGKAGTGIGIWEILPYAFAVISSVLLFALIVVAVNFFIKPRYKGNTIYLNIKGEEKINRSSDLLIYVPAPRFSLLPGFKSASPIKGFLMVGYFIISILPVFDENIFIMCVMISLPFVISGIRDLTDKTRPKTNFKTKVAVLVTFSSIFILSICLIFLNVVKGNFESKFASRLFFYTAQNLERMEIGINPELFYKGSIMLSQRDFLPYMLIGEKLEKDGKKDEAAEYYKKAVEKCDGAYEAYMKLGLIFESKRELDSALEMFERARNIKQDYLPAYLEAARVLLEKGSIQDANMLVDKASGFDSSDIELYRLKAEIMLAQNDLEGAEAACNKAITLKPERSDLYREKAEILTAQNRFDEALAYIEKALSLNSDDAESNYIKGMIQLKCNQPEKAAESFKKARDIDGGFAPADAGLALAELESGAGQGVAGLLERALEKGNNMPQVNYICASVYNELGDYKKAEELIEKAIKLDGFNADFYSLKALLLMERGNMAGAESELNKAAAINKRSSYVHYVKGLLSIYNDEFEEAADELNLAVSYHPYFSKAFASLAIALNSMGEKEKAYEKLENAYRLNNKDYYNDYAKSVIFFDQKRYNEAMTAVNAAIQKNPGKAQLYLMKYRILKAQGVDEGKTESIDKAYDLYPDMYDIMVEKADAISNDAEAIQRLDEITVLYPDTYVAFIYKASRLMKMGKYNEAASCADYAILKNPESYRGYVAKYKAATALGSSINERMGILDRLLAINRFYPDAYFEKGQLLLEQAKFGEAVDMFMKALETNPGTNLSRVKKSEIYSGLNRAYMGLQLYDKAAEAERKMQGALKIEQLGIIW